MIKLKFLYLLSFIGAFFAGIQTAMIAIFVLIVFDLIFGLLVARKIKQDITSRKLSKSIVKLIVYEMLIICAHITELYLIPVFPLIPITIGFLGVIEFLSISESFTKLTGINFINYIKGQLYNRLKQVEKNKSIKIGSTGEVK